MILGFTQKSLQAPLGGVVTILDTAYFCQYYAAELLIYGRLLYTEEYADIVLKLYDPSRQELIGTFYGKDDAAELDRLLSRIPR